jgi:eukaryotic-like serine/threonine-protein kinase
MVKCTNCDVANREGTKYCSKCGQAFATCPNCGAVNRNRAKFCWECGHRVKALREDITCSICNAVNRGTAKFCCTCGQFLLSLRDLRPGTAIGNYIVLRRVGVGGIGAVYEARHKSLKQRVAIKVHDYFPEDKYVGAAFLQAANYLSQLSHPNIVHLHDFGFQYERAYQIIEYIEGGVSLKGNIPNQMTKHWLEHSYGYLLQILDAVNYAHNCQYLDTDGIIKQGIIHGDIKPQNILLDRMADVVKLTDFMIPDVQAFLGEKQGPRPIQTGQLGTVGYMAPEQEANEQLTEQTDIFSLGATIYQVVTGHLPHPAKIWNSERTAKKINPDVPSWLDHLIVKAMSFYPADRFQTVALMIRTFKENLTRGESSRVINIQGNIQEVNMERDPIHIENSDFSNISGQIMIGNFNNVVAKLNAVGETELVDVLKTLKEAVLASKLVSEEKKEELIGSINQVGEEAAKPKPNKTLLKMLGDGLMATLKVIPDLASTVAAVSPMLIKLGI